MGGDVAVSPAVGDHRTIRRCGSGTPGYRRVSVGALGVGDTFVGEGENTR